MSRQQYEYRSFIESHSVNLGEITDSHKQALGSATLDWLRGLSLRENIAAGLSNEDITQAHSVAQETDRRVMERLTATTINGYKLMEEQGDTRGQAMYRRIRGTEPKPQNTARDALRQTRGWSNRNLGQTRDLLHAMLDWRTAFQAREAINSSSIDVVMANIVYPNVSCFAAGRAIECMFDEVRLRQLIEPVPSRNDPSEQTYNGWRAPRPGTNR
jgi:hypothetical protein